MGHGSANLVITKRIVDGHEEYVGSVVWDGDFPGACVWVLRGYLPGVCMGCVRAVMSRLGASAVWTGDL